VPLTIKSRRNSVGFINVLDDSYLSTTSVSTAVFGKANIYVRFTGKEPLTGEQ
jgi:hypothetical protein